MTCEQLNANNVTAAAMKNGDVLFSIELHQASRHFRQSSMADELDSKIKGPGSIALNNMHILHECPVGEKFARTSSFKRFKKLEKREGKEGIM